MTWQARPRRLFALWRLAGFALSVVVALPAAVAAAPVDEKRDELKVLRDQIKSLQQDILRGEEHRTEAADDLAEAERAISSAQRRLRQIAGNRRQVEAELSRLSQERKTIETELSVLRKQLGDTLYRLYVEGGEAGARRLLSGDDPNRIARDAYYLGQIARQRAVAIEEARAALRNLEQVIAAAEARRAELALLEGERRDEQGRLAQERQKQRAVLTEISERLRAQRREMQSLQRDQARLEKLLRGLEAIAREAARKRTAASKAQANRPQTKPPAGKSAPSVAGQAPAEPVVGRATDVPDERQPQGSFAALRGKLRWPVKGELAGRFGAPRAGGGALWRGVFIRAAEGSEVRAVAPGMVAYADWLRGFGNLLIVDHGDGYMTIYGNNESLQKSPGDVVKSGEVIATVGASGGAEESGLYFEIRRRGEPSDPAKWVAAR